MSGDILVVITGWGRFLLAHSGQRTGALLNIRQWSGRSTTKNDLAQVSMVLRLSNAGVVGAPAPRSLPQLWRTELGDPLFVPLRPVAVITDVGPTACQALLCVLCVCNSFQPPSGPPR